VQEQDPIGNLFWTFYRYNQWNEIAAKNANNNNKTDPKDIQLAEIKFRKILVYDTSNSITYHLLGKVLFQLNKFTAAEICFEKAKQHALPQEATLFRLDSIMMQYTDTLLWNCYRYKFFDLQYDPAEDDYYLALIHEKTNRLNEAAFYFRAALYKNPAIEKCLFKIIQHPRKYRTICIGRKTLLANLQQFKEAGH
jgi:tetratricopeptide (TPR) repeat protein